MAFVKANSCSILIDNETFISNQIESVGVSVPKIWAKGQALGNSFIVMEAITGVNLSTLLSTGSNNSLSLSSVAEQLVSIVDSLRRAGIVHRDLTPSNILVSSESCAGNVHLIDFCFAVSIDADFRADLQLDRWKLERLGEGYKPGPNRWDDAYAAMNIVEELQSAGLNVSKQAQLLRDRIGRLEYFDDSWSSEA
jgi:tRNA A-37 threonylcarbamoyl transferase component Bud32